MWQPFRNFWSEAGMRGPETAARRVHEIGIRMALGAKSGSVAWMLIGGSLRLVALGLAIGLPLALGASLAISRLLFGFGPLDPVSLGASGAALLVFGALAAGLPARRAARVDPMIALRLE